MLKMAETPSASLSKRIEDLADGRYTHKFLLLHVDLEVPDAALETLTAISPLNKTDVLTLASAFGNVKNILLASRQALERCPGIGEKKARRILKVVRQPFFSPLSSASASAHFATSASSSPPSSSDSSLSSAPALPPPLSSPLCIRDDAS